MNQLCKVCGEPAAGYHFGAFTCEGCKSFFGRTYNNLSALGECKNNGECVINKKNRTSCKSCRLKKCLMVGMSKSGSRYGRRSNWFKIHCLIQDQQEMSNRMAEASKNVVQDELSVKLSETKDFIAKYKENEMRNSAQASMAELNSRISPRLNSPNSSEGSLGRSVSSPYSSLFEGAKVPAFPSPYLSASASLGPAANDFQKEFSNLATRFNPAALPLTPISPLSPLNAVSRLFLQNTSALLGKRFNELQKLQSEQLLASRAFLPLTQATLNNVLKPSSKDMVEEMTNGAMPQFYGDLPEQDGPIDLSVKRIHDFGELTLTTETKCSKPVPGDHDSGFSPSSNEDNHTSPLDLTAKRQCLALSHHRNMSMNIDVDTDDHVDVEEDEDETSDVEVQDDEPMMETAAERQDARHEIECAP